MYSLLLNWDLSNQTKEIIQTLREYIAKESWERYRNKEGLIQKVWYSNEDTAQFGAFYLWETKEALEQEVATMYRVKSVTGVDPTITVSNIEAVQEGIHNIRNIFKAGLAWEE
jgi:hypothetical protein